jgi:heme/copper-type cytochrome/quinol oxidase subunit 2
MYGHKIDPSKWMPMLVHDFLMLLLVIAGFITFPIMMLLFVIVWFLTGIFSKDKAREREDGQL